MEKVAVVGASNNEERYSCKAMKMLEQHGHIPVPVAPAKKEILGKKAFEKLADVDEKIDTVTMYVGPARQTEVIDEIINLAPKRVIFNPGTENPLEYGRLRDAGINVIEACTLVLLRTNQF
jgi:predicted CoA-binding protein